jgi:hypothetical protein
MPSRSRFLASQTKPGPNIELAVARKSIFRDSTEEQVSTMSLENFSGMVVAVGDYIGELLGRCDRSEYPKDCSPNS